MTASFSYSIHSAVGGAKLVTSQWSHVLKALQRGRDRGNVSDPSAEVGKILQRERKREEIERRERNKVSDFLLDLERCLQSPPTERKREAEVFEVFKERERGKKEKNKVSDL